MGDCRTDSCSDRRVVPQVQVWQHEIPMAAPCSGGSCAPRIDRMPTRILEMPPAPYGRSCDGGVCQPTDTRAFALQPFDKSKHESNINNNFDFTEKDYSKALAKAAKEGKPLVVVFASDRTPGAMNAGDSVKSAQNSRVGQEGWPVKGNAVFVYVDSEKAAQNPELNKLMNDKLITPGIARTIIYNAEIGADGKVKAVPTALNNDKSGFDGAQLAADIHSAKAYSRPLNVAQTDKSSTSDSVPKAKDAPAAPAVSEKDAELAQLRKELQEMKAELARLRPKQAAEPGDKPGVKPEIKPKQPESKVPAALKPETKLPETKLPVPQKPDSKVVDKPKAPVGLDLLKPDPPSKAELEKKEDFAGCATALRSRMEHFQNFYKVEDRRLSGALATVKDDHPTATSETTKWLREQDDMNLLADRDIRAKLNGLGTYWTTSGRRADEDALVQKRAEQWQDVRLNAANPNDPNHASKQFMLYEFMKGLHTDGSRFGNTNESRVGDNVQELRTDRLKMQVEAAETLAKIASNPAVSHELSARLIAEGLNDTKVPMAARLKLLDAIEPLSENIGNKYLNSDQGATAAAMVVRAMLKSHETKEDNGEFQRAAMDKLVKMKAYGAYGVIDFLSRESGSVKTQEHARNLIQNSMEIPYLPKDGRQLRHIKVAELSREIFGSK